MLSSLGYKVFHNINNFGKFIYFSGIVLKRVVLFKYKFRLVIDQVVKLGLYSLPIVIFTALFVGMAFSVQVVKELLRFGAPDLVGGVVAIAIWRELGLY